jgi:hypothetical protein
MTHYGTKPSFLNDFCSPWNSKNQAEIAFRAVWDTENLFFNFKVFDTHIQLNKKDDSIESIGSSDRVELFFRTDSSSNPL